MEKLMNIYSFSVLLQYKFLNSKCIDLLQFKARLAHSETATTE